MGGREKRAGFLRSDKPSRFDPSLAPSVPPSSSYPPSLPELMGSLELGNVWVFVQLIFGPHWPMNQLNKNPNMV